MASAARIWLAVGALGESALLQWMCSLAAMPWMPIRLAGESNRCAGVEAGNHNKRRASYPIPARLRPPTLLESIKARSMMPRAVVVGLSSISSLVCAEVPALFASFTVLESANSSIPSPQNSSLSSSLLAHNGSHDGVVM